MSSAGINSTEEAGGAGTGVPGATDAISGTAGGGSRLGVLQARNAPGIVLYLITLVCQVPGAFARGIATFLFLAVCQFLTGWPIPVQVLADVLAGAPLALSALCLLCPPIMDPLVGNWWEYDCGGRPPEEDEQDAFDYAFGLIQEVYPEARPPRHWFVAEDPGQGAAAYAASIRVDRGLLEEPAAAGTIGHEYEHIIAGDARMDAALHLQLWWPMDTPKVWEMRSLPFRAFLWLAGGQAALWFTANAWESYWRAREYDADQYAFKIDQGDEVADYLEEQSLPYERPVRRMRFSRASHPYTKPRITRLRGVEQAAAPAIEAQQQLKLVEAESPAVEEAERPGLDEAGRGEQHPNRAHPHRGAPNPSSQRDYPESSGGRVA